MQKKTSRTREGQRGCQGKGRSGAKALGLRPGRSRGGLEAQLGRCLVQAGGEVEGRTQTWLLALTFGTLPALGGLPSLSPGETAYLFRKIC